MSIHKRIQKSGVRYLAVVTLPRGKQFAKIFRRKIDAEAWEAEQKQIVKGGVRKVLVMERSRTKLEEFCEIWLRRYAEPNKTPSSLRRDVQIIENQIMPMLGACELADITEELIEGWRIGLRKGGLAPKTCNNCLNLMKKILSDAVRWKYLEQNEAKYVSAFRIQRADPKYWGREETVRFLGTVKEECAEYFVTFALALYAGLRKGEIRGLKWDCVDLSRMGLVVRRIYCAVQNEVVERTKGKKDRWVPINGQLAVVLRSENVKGDGADGFVVREFDWAHSHRVMDRLCEKAGVRRIRFHDLRHTFASNLVMAGKPLYEVQKLLGHASYGTTEKYAHLAPEYLKGATDCLKFEE